MVAFLLIDFLLLVSSIKENYLHMKQIKKVPGFEHESLTLTVSHNSIRNGYLERINLSKKLADIIHDMVGNPKISAVLRLPATSKDPALWHCKIISDEMKFMTLLEMIIFIGIEQSQSPNNNNPMQVLVIVQRKDLESIGWIPGKKYETEFKQVAEATNNFVHIHPGNKSTNTEIWEFGCTCHYNLPFPEMKNVTA